MTDFYTNCDMTLGMFLYVRIILDNLEHLGSIEEIRQELRVLPKDLADA